MRSRPCRHPTCPNYVARPADYCEQHAHEPPARAERHRYYDQHIRNPESKRFYDSAAWQTARRIKLTSCPWCERCEGVLAAHVHHMIPVAEATPAQRIAQHLLLSVCMACHNEIEAEIRAINGGRDATR